MFKNYFSVAWRNLLKHKTFTCLNLVGLSVAFAVAILLGMTAFFELSYDKFHENADNIHKVYWVGQTPKGPVANVTHSAPLMDAIKSSVPGIEKTSRHLEQEAIISYGETEINTDAIWVDADFFNMFSFPSIAGKIDDPLASLSEIVITEDIAKKFFGDSNAIGKTVQVLINGKDTPFTVSSIVKNNLPQSTLEFGAALRFEMEGSYAANKDSWNARYHDIYVQLEASANALDFEEATRSLVDINFKERMENAKRDGAKSNEDGRFYSLELLPLVDQRFTNFRKGFADTSRTTPYLVLGVAFLILFIAFVNFVNMSVAKGGQRLKEIGIRKTLGVKQRQLFFSFWVESLLLFCISVVAGFVLSFILLDSFKTMFATDVSFAMVFSPIVIFSFLAIVLLITFLVGGYPSLLFSKLGIIQSLKGKMDAYGKNRVRDILMVIQFSIAILMISGTLVIKEQLHFMRSKDLGFNKEQVISFPLDGKKDSYQALELLRNELKANPDIIEVTGADNNLGYGKDGSVSKSMMGFEYKNRVVNTNLLVVDYDYVETLDLEMVAGRNFKRGYASDSLSVVINEAMAKELGEKNPLTASVNFTDSISYPVLGVVKDYNFENLNRAIEPMTMVIARNWDLYYAYVKVAPTNLATSFDAIEKAWGKIEPNADFLGSFLDENINRTFRKEERMSAMITSGAVIAIVLSCIGLFAMSLLVVNQRTKEIGIRKVVGAGLGSLLFLLTKDFLKMVLIAFVVIVPIAWIASTNWLENYPYRMHLSMSLFGLAGVLAMAIAVATISTGTIRAALQNPTKSLRTE